MVVESTVLGGDVVSCTAGCCIYTSGNGETTVKQCGRCRRRPWYDILISIASCCRLGRVVECIRFMTLLCKGWLIHSIKLWGHDGNGETTMMMMMMMQCRGHHPPWSDLPNDILISIASRLSRAECIRFMTVCKGWLHSIKPHGHHNHLKPCLLVMEREDQGWVSLYTPFPSKTYKLRIPDLKETFFRFSKDGWILLSKTSAFNPRLFLLNLLTGAKFDLPDLGTHPTGFCGMCFISTPGSSDFMVVLIRSVSVTRVTIFTYSPSITTDDLKQEKEKWTEECYHNSSRTSFLGVSCSPVLYKKKLYCLDHFGHLGVFDHVRKNWTTFDDRPKYFVVNPPPPEYHNYMLARLSPAFRDFSYKSFMVDLEGEDLISVFVSKRKTEEVHIFRLEEEDSCCKMGWEKVDSLGMGELFVGLQTSISTIQVPYGSWNNLYFPGFKSDHRDVIFSEAYSLETKAYDPSCSSIWRDPLKSTWIELPMSKWESIFYSKWKRM